MMAKVGVTRGSKGHLVVRSEFSKSEWSPLVQSEHSKKSHTKQLGFNYSKALHSISVANP